MIATAEKIDAAVRDQDGYITARVLTAAEHRAELIRNLRRLSVYTAELPDAAAAETYERVREAERAVAPNLLLHEYKDGTARSDDEVRVCLGSGALLMSADHATDPVRLNAIHDTADHGTAGIAIVLRDEGIGTAVLPIGLQTMDANSSLDHPLKDALAEHIAHKQGFLSIHGCMPGKFTHQYDDVEVHGVIGLGSRYDEQSYDIAHTAIGKLHEEFGVRFVIGNDSKLYTPDTLPQLPRNLDGTLKYRQLAARGEGTTTNHIHNTDPAKPAFQVELSRSIRFLPDGMEYRSPEAARVGVHMGLYATRRLAEIIASWK